MFLFIFQTGDMTCLISKIVIHQCSYLFFRQVIWLALLVRLSYINVPIYFSDRWYDLDIYTGCWNYYYCICVWRPPVLCLFWQINKVLYQRGNYNYYSSNHWWQISYTWRKKWHFIFPFNDHKWDLTFLGSYVSWIYIYLNNQYLSSQKLQVWFPTVMRIVSSKWQPYNVSTPLNP